MDEFINIPYSLPEHSKNEQRVSVKIQSNFFLAPLIEGLYNDDDKSMET
ncbi:MAG: hypothetical protein PUG60_10135 [Lachnospiraceae bacterium]|nr:hypothetical protein [Lachnospiraceae bacterium]